MLKTCELTRIKCIDQKPVVEPTAKQTCLVLMNEIKDTIYYRFLVIHKSLLIGWLKTLIGASPFISLLALKLQFYLNNI